MTQTELMSESSQRAHGWIAQCRPAAHPADPLFTPQARQGISYGRRATATGSIFHPFIGFCHATVAGELPELP